MDELARVLAHGRGDTYEALGPEERDQIDEQARHVQTWIDEHYDSEGAYEAGDQEDDEAAFFDGSITGYKLACTDAIAWLDATREGARFNAERFRTVNEIRRHVSALERDADQRALQIERNATT